MPKTIKKVCFVDDEPLILDIYSLSFNQAGYQVFTADNGDDGIALIRKIRPDIAFVDLIMGKTSGFDVLKAIKHDKRYKSIPIIVLTNYDSEEARLQACRLGSLYYIIKPDYRPKELVSLADEILKVRKILPSSICLKNNN